MVLDEATGGLRFVDDDGVEVRLDPHEARTLWALHDGLDAATVSACPDCRSRMLAVVALADRLDEGPPHARTLDLLALCEDAPTLHLCVVDEGTRCRHERWRDPGFEEWAEVVGPPPLTRPGRS